MTIYIAAWHYRARVVVQRTWGWSPIEELVLLYLDKTPGTMASVAADLDLPAQVVGATVSRLMQFGLVELRTSPRPMLSTSMVGQQLIRSGRPLPERTADRELTVSLVYERIGQSVFRRRDVSLRSAADIGQFAAVVRFTQDEPEENDETMATRVYRLMAGTLRPGEWLRGVRAVNSVLTRRYLEIDLDNVRQGIFPTGASNSLVNALRATAATGILPAPPPPERTTPPPIETDFRAERFVVGTTEHVDKFVEVVDRAIKDVFVLSTFVAPQGDEKGRPHRDRVLDALARAIERGVRCHLFFGTSDNVAKSAHAMEEIRTRLSATRLVRGFLFVHRDTVRSHAKFLAADDGDNRAVVVFGSCNWLSSPFSAVEVSVELTDAGAASLGLDMLRAIVATLPDASRSVEAMGFMADELRRAFQGGSSRSASSARGQRARLKVVYAPGHERLLRRAAHEAEARFVCCTNRMGSTMVPALFAPTEIAGRRLDDVRILYSRYSGPTKRRHVSEHRQRLHGVVDIIPVREPQLHCKFLLWDDDHVVVSTLNWGSQTGREENPLDEIGLYLEGPQLATSLLAKIERYLSEEDEG